MNSAVLIDNEKLLENLGLQLQTEPLLGIDTESDSYYSYEDKICMLQVSVPAADYIVDPLAISDLKPLKPIFADEQIEKIFHDGTNDIKGLKADFGFYCRNIFDTAVAWRMIAGEHKGLAYLLEIHFGISHNKKFQKWDWRKRPLQETQIKYAQIDTHYLIPLRNILCEKLEALGLTERFREKMKSLETLEKTPRRFNPNGFWRLKGAQNLDSDSLRVLKELYRYRESIAQRLNKAAFRVINGDLMIRLARRKPKTLKEILSLRGLPKYIKKQRATELLSVIQRAVRK